MTADDPPLGLIAQGRDGVATLVPHWSMPSHVHAVVTTRQGGASLAPYDSLNLSLNVGDEAAAVATNRLRVRQSLLLPTEPSWLRQVHGTRVVNATTMQDIEADGSFTHGPGRVCAVMTADCLPVLLCDRQGTRVAALHAGWRGLVGGVLEAGVAALGLAAEEIVAWLGPAISQDNFEVGPEVRQAFLAVDREAAACFKPGLGDRWQADLYGLARHRLARVGVRQVVGGNYCTVRQSTWFYSHRRDGRCGRMAALIWLSDQN
jgi:YfiH family protein